jgi:hypothetical protein
VDGTGLEVADEEVVQSGSELVEPMAPIGGRVRDQPEHEAA